MELRLLADELGVSVSDVKAWLKTNGHARADRTFAGAAVTLTREEERAVREAHEQGLLRRDRGTLASSPVAAPPPLEPPPDPFAALPAARTAAEPPDVQGQPAHPTYLHVDVLQWLEEAPPDLRRNFTRRVQEMLSYGRATRMKGVRGVNAGWLRAPLGGNQGKQFYLWVSNQGESIRGQEDETRALHQAYEPRARFLRAVRHHDATKDRLDVGHPSDYAPVTPTQALGDGRDGFADPLVEAQREAVSSRARIRVLQGRPGAGKTTCLDAIVPTLHGRALYLTWSAPLADRARDWHRTFAPAGLQLDVWTLEHFFHWIDPDAAGTGPSLGLADAVGALARELAPLESKLAAWRDRHSLLAEALYAELHAQLVGAHLSVQGASAEPGAPVPVDEDGYRAERVDAIGEKAVTAALRALRHLGPAAARRLFPAPLRAFALLGRLERGQLELPAGPGYDWVLVDEVQDLTTMEQRLLVEVVRRLGALRGVRPGLVLAGDESQTVRPTAFTFSRLHKELERLGPRTEWERHVLDASLRAPEAIAAFVDLVDSHLYARLPRGERPRGRRIDEVANVTVGRVVEVDVSEDAALSRLCETLAALSGEAALVYPGIRPPERYAEAAAAAGLTLWTSDAIKGLEVRIACVLDAGLVMEEVREASADQQLEVERARSAIDRLLVALSRATEVLVLAHGSEQSLRGFRALEFARQIEGESASEPEPEDPVASGWVGLVPLEELAATLEVDAADALDRVQALLSQSESLEGAGRLQDAHQAASAAKGLLGRAGRPGAAGRDLREQVYRRLAELSFACGMQAVERKQGAPLGYFEQAARAYHWAGEREAGRAATAVKKLFEPLRSSEEWPGRLLAVVKLLPALRDKTPRIALALMTPLLRQAEERLPEALDEAGRRGDLLDALSLAGQHAPLHGDAFRRLADEALRRVLTENVRKHDPEAQREYARWRPRLEDPVLGARLDAADAERRGNHAEALRRWEALGELADALRCARRGAQYGEAVRLAKLLGHEDLGALQRAYDLEALLLARVKGKLVEPELERLRELWEKAFDAPQASRRRR